MQFRERWRGAFFYRFCETLKGVRTDFLELGMKESYKEELAIHFGLDPYAGDGDISGVASARGNAGQPLSSEIILLVCRRRDRRAEGNIDRTFIG